MFVCFFFFVFVYLLLFVCLCFVLFYFVLFCFLEKKKVPKTLFPGVFTFWGSEFAFKYPVGNHGNFGVFIYVFSLSNQLQ